MDEQNETPQDRSPSKGYGKRPRWQWVVIYLVAGALIYGLIYYLFIRSDSGVGY